MRKETMTSTSWQRRSGWCMNGDKHIFEELWIPAENGPHPCAIISHGLDGTHKNGEAYAGDFASNGIAVVTFDFCGGSVQAKSDGETTDMSVMT